MEFAKMIAWGEDVRRRRAGRVGVEAGFSLTELLVMIGVIGVLTALVVGRLAGVADEAREVTDRRNAQNIAMVAAVADTLGSDRLALAADLETAVRLVAGGSGGGLTIGDRGRGVAVSGLSAGELQGALRFLRFENGKVVYTGAGDPGWPRLDRIR